MDKMTDGNDVKAGQNYVGNGYKHKTKHLEIYSVGNIKQQKIQSLGELIELGKLVW